MWKFTILTIFVYNGLKYIHIGCAAITLFQNSFHCRTETLSPSNNNFFFSPSLTPLVTTIQCSVFYEFDSSRYLIWRRRWHPTPVLLPGKSHGQRSLVACSPWSRWVGHDWVTSLSLFTFVHWRRKWQCTPLFLPGESQGRGSLVGCRLWGHAESDMTEAT